MISTARLAGSCPEQIALVEKLRQKLLDNKTSLAAKHRVLFALRSVQSGDAQAALEAALQDPSDLLRHEVAYCLGQQQRTEAAATLAALLHSQQEHSMVRHEAAEALGAIGSPACLSLVRAFCSDPCLEVAQTCQLAVQRIDFFATQTSEADSRYPTVDPAPPADPSVPFTDLRDALLDDSAPIFQRYRAMFAVRNRGGPEAVEALGSALQSNSALLKHEVAYVLGQMGDLQAMEYLRGALSNSKENAMVRHEAAEALGSIADPSCIELLELHRHDPDKIVADSCEVALDMLAHEQSGDFEYVDLGLPIVNMPVAAA